MTKKSHFILITTIFLLLVSACTPSKTPIPISTGTQNAPTAEPTVQSPTATATLSPTSTEQPPFIGDGYSFLLQTDFSAYQIIDCAQKTSLPFEPPGEAKQYNLAANISPSRSFIAFPQGADDIGVMNLEDGQLIKINPIAGIDSTFKMEAAAEFAQNMLSDLDVSVEITTATIQDAYDQSKSIFRWYQNDHTWLIAAESDVDRTNLHLYDLETESLTQLEAEPGLVQSASSSSSGEFILLKKGFLFDASAWEDDRYYLINVNEGSTQPIPLPEGSDLPQVFWFDSENIGIVHQARLIGGFDFSLFNIQTGQSTKIFNNEFTELSLFIESLLVLSPDGSDNATKVEFRSLNGEILHSQSINSLCTINHIFESHAILNCEMESMLLDENLQLAQFDDPMFITAPAPNGDQLLSVVRTGEIKLLDSNLSLIRSISLEEAPLEIRWMPDSSGFLYRGRGKIYWYDLTTQNSNLLIESDLFNDYTNMNGVWIGGN